MLRAKKTVPEVPKTEQPIDNIHSRAIAEYDSSVMSLVRKMWMESRSPAETAKWRKKLDNSLDERLRLMKLRDTFQS